MKPRAITAVLISVFALGAVFSIIPNIVSPGVLSTTPVFAAGFLPTATGKCPEDYKTPGKSASGSCEGGEAARDYAVDDVKTLLVKISNWLFGISGAVALLLFVLGGFFWILSAGQSSMVEKGKKIMIDAVIGIVIMLFAYTGVAFGLKVFMGDAANEYLPATAGSNKSSGSGASGLTIGSISSANKNLGDLGDGSGEVCGQLGGKCLPEGACGTGYAVAGACGTGTTCCLDVADESATTPCSKLGGVCQGVSKKCNGLYVQNFCPKGNSNQCCLVSQ